MHEPAYPASLTKIATSIYAYQLAQSLDERIVAEPICLKKMNQSKKQQLNYKIEPYLLEPDGTHFWMLPREELSFYDLLCGLLLSSGNDASNVVAHHFGKGSIKAFVDQLNIFLKEIGCKNTHFANPHGLHHPDHYTTAYDLAQMAKFASKLPEIVEIAGKKQYYRPKTNKQNRQRVYQMNRLISNSPFSL